MISSKYRRVANISMLRSGTNTAQSLTLVRLLGGLIIVLELRNGIQFVLEPSTAGRGSLHTITEHPASEQHGP